MRRLLPYFGEGFDIVHLEDGWLAQELLDLILLKKALGVKVIVSFRGADLFVNSLFNADTCKTLLQVSDDVHFVSEALMLRARELGLSESRGRVILPGVDPAVFDRGCIPYPPPKDGTGSALRLLSVGRLDWGKGYEYGLKAASIVAQRGVKLRYDIVGGGTLRDALRYAVWQMGLEGAVQFHGDLPRDKILPLLRQTDIYLQSSVREGLPNTVLEAQSFKVPVVCTDAGGTAEALEEGVTGFVVPTRDPQALADRICELAGDEDLRVRMGAQGRKRVLAGFTLEQQAARFLEFYKEVANR
ncbi:MAG TPA: glycosyltransferase family 4 protein [bacterium]|nr:glycosyltransferase family 4 protein [bacterium]